MRLAGVSFVVVFVLGGCDVPPDQPARAVCSAFCECIGGLPSQVESCVVDDCVPDVTPVSDACLQCVDENAHVCTSLFRDCVQLCLSQPTP